MSAIFWFRSDLRLHFNQALHQAIEHGAKRAVFFVTPKQWSLHHKASIQIDLIERRINALGQQLADAGIILDIIHTDCFVTLPNALNEYCEEHGATQVFANIEYGLNEAERDKACLAAGINLTLQHGDVYVAPGKVLNGSGGMFKVFTPFKRAWLKYLIQNPVSPVGNYQSQQALLKVDWHPVTFEQVEKLDSSKWPVDDDTLSGVIQRFVSEKMPQYHNLRDIPSVKATSGFSAYLAIGAIGVGQLVHAILYHEPEIFYHEKQPNFTWLNELIWREFYRHLLHFTPRLSKLEDFSDKFTHLKWPDNSDYFQAWCDGKTGYPIVDAAMRQLNQTGWMHNRLRMIVASFLTKHLQVDWRMGEQYFMSKLIDGDHASNNGGWQWAASTGCDAQPYFRIFNPIRQSENFDPDGSFIRKYVPELKDLPSKAIHFPHSYLSQLKQHDYWPALVDHKAAREAALAFYKA